MFVKQIQVYFFPKKRGFLKFKKTKKLGGIKIYYGIEQFLV